LNIGCGGSQDTWAVSVSTPQETTAPASFTCVDVSGQPGYGTCTRR